MASTSAGAIKDIIEAGGLNVAAYRDALPKLSSLPCVTIDEDVATTQERDGDSTDPTADHGEQELLYVHIWQAWRNSAGKPAETYTLPRAITRLLRNAPPFAYGDPPTRVYGLRVDGRARITEEKDNVVHTTITVTMRRDA